MKKQLLLLSMISLFTLASCGEKVNSIDDGNGNQVIVKIGDTNYTANDLFKEYSNTSSGASQYFSAIYDVVINAVQPETMSIRKEVSQEINKFYQDAESSAKENNTSTKAEISKALESKGVESVEELEELYLLQQKKTAYENKFYDDNLNDSLLSEYINYYAPYHVRHILVKTSSGSSLYEGTISKDDATNLADVVSDLARGNQSFGTIAQAHAANGDTESANTYGDVGIMSTLTSFVSEFKYSLYQYDAYYNDSAKTNVTAYNERQATRKVGNTLVDGTSLVPYATGSSEETLLKDSVNYIDYKVFTDLKKYASYTTDNLKNGYKEEKYLPRNIIFNQHLNNHALGVVTKGTTGPNSNRFQYVKNLSKSTSEEDKILCDEAGRPILVTRAGTGSGDSGYQGIHFIIAQKSPFVQTGTEDLLQELKAYYDTENYDKATSTTYVKFINSSTTKELTDRADKVKSNIKEIDSYMNYRIYEKALEELRTDGKEVKFNESVDIANIITKYIDANRTSSNYTTQKSYKDSWKAYINLLKVQNQVENRKVAESMIPTVIEQNI